MNVLPGKAQRLITSDVLGSTSGMICHSDLIAARRPSTLCTAVGYLGGHGGDVWIVRHDDGVVAVYAVDDLEPSAAPPVPVTCGSCGVAVPSVDAARDEGWIFLGGWPTHCQPCDVAPRCRICDAVATSADGKFCARCEAAS